MRTAPRRGLTLIEMLIVMALIVVLLGLVVAVGPRIGDKQRATRGASQVQSWLRIARGRAVRSMTDIHPRPSGVRLLNPSGPFEAQYVTELQYIETPAPFTGGNVEVPFDNTQIADRYKFVRLRGVEVPLTGNAAVQAGDVIDLTVAGLYPPDEASAVRRIVNITPVAANEYQVELDAEIRGSVLSYTPADTATRQRQLSHPVLAIGPTPPRRQDYSTETPAAISPNPDGSLAQSSNYLIYRQARPLLGEPTLQLPRGVAIDISRENVPVGQTPGWFRLFPGFVNTGGTGPLDILFDPSGRVVSPIGASSARVCFWVRDATVNTTGPLVGNNQQATDPTQLPPGENSIICIYTRTGLVAAHPVDARFLTPNATPTANTWNPFFYTQGAQSSGQ